MSSNNPYQAPKTSPTVAASPGEPVSEHGRPLATRLERFLGALIDGVINAVVLVPLSIFVLVPMIAGMTDGQASVGFQIVLAVVGFILGMLVLTLIHGYTLAKSGQTLGKVLMKTQIVFSDTGQILPLPQVIGMRYGVMGILGSIPFVGGIIGLVNALMVFRKNQRCLHDDIAGTEVIKFQS